MHEHPRLWRGAHIITQADEEEPPAKMTKLAISADREEDKYEHKTVLKCWKCDPVNGLEIPSAMNDPHVKSLSDGVMQALSSARQSEVQAWEEEITPCEHTLTLQQEATGPIQASGGRYFSVRVWSILIQSFEQGSRIARNAI